MKKMLKLLPLVLLLASCGNNGDAPAGGGGSPLPPIDPSAEIDLDTALAQLQALNENIDKTKSYKGTVRYQSNELDGPADLTASIYNCGFDEYKNVYVFGAEKDESGSPKVSGNPGGFWNDATYENPYLTDRVSTGLIDTIDAIQHFGEDAGGQGGPETVSYTMKVYHADAKYSLYLNAVYVMYGMSMTQTTYYVFDHQGIYLSFQNQMFGMGMSTTETITFTIDE